MRKGSPDGPHGVMSGSSIPDDAVVFNDAVELNSVQNGLSTDWQDLIYRQGSQLNNQLSVSAGSDKTRVFIAFSNFKEEGLIEGVDYKTVYRTYQR